MKLSGEVVLVTGGDKGIDRGIALRAVKGAHVLAELHQTGTDFASNIAPADGEPGNRRPLGAAPHQTMPGA